MARPHVPYETSYAHGARCQEDCFCPHLRRLAHFRIMACMVIQTADRDPLAWTVGERFRKARELIGLDQETMAAAVGVARKSISRWENNVSAPRRPVILSWALRTGVPYEWLLTGEVAVNGPDGGGAIAGPGAGEQKSRCLPLLLAAA